MLKVEGDEKVKEDLKILTPSKLLTGRHVLLA